MVLPLNNQTSKIATKCWRCLISLGALETHVSHSKIVPDTKEAKRKLSNTIIHSSFIFLFQLCWFIYIMLVQKNWEKWIFMLCVFEIILQEQEKFNNNALVSSWSSCWAADVFLFMSFIMNPHEQVHVYSTKLHNFIIISINIIWEWSTYIPQIIIFVHFLYCIFN